MSTSIHNEVELLAQLANNDEQAFRKIYDGYRRRIFAFIYLLTKSEDITEELVQEVFIKLWYMRHKLNDVNNFNAWLHTVTKNLVVDQIRKIAKENAGKKSLSNKLSFSANYTDDVIFSRENEQILQKAIEQLSPQQKTIYLLSRTEELKNDEIATRLNISSLTVKNHLVNAMRIIRAYFRKHALLLLLIIFNL